MSLFSSWACVICSLTLYGNLFAAIAEPRPQVSDVPPAAVADESRTIDVQNRALVQLIRDLETSLAAGNWGQAVTQFDSGWKLVSSGEDPLLIPMAGDVNQLAAGRHEVAAGGRATLESVFQKAPDAFRREFLRQYSAAADQSLADAVRQGRLDSLKHVATRYRFLPAAETAIRLTARIALDRGDFLEAALQLERLKRLLDNKVSNELLLQMALVEWRADLRSDAEDNLRALIAAASDGNVALGTDSFRLPKPGDDLSLWLQNLVAHQPEDDSASAADTVAANGPRESDWLQPLGSYRRVQSRPQEYSQWKPDWTSDLFVVSDVLFQDKINPILSEARQQIRLALSRDLAENKTVIPVPSPLVVGDLLVFRTAAGVRAVQRETGELIWETTHPDGRLRSLSEQRDRDDERGPYNALLLAREMFYQLTRTNTAGQLSSDGRTLFVVEDSAWVTWDSDPDFRPSAVNRLPANFLRAYDVKTGVFRWEAGGQRSSGPHTNLLAGYYFLGTPLVFGSRIYVLAESSEGIFLLQVGEPESKAAAIESGRKTTGGGNPRILSSQLLASPQFTLTQHPVRKHAGLTPSYAHGLLICPTCDEHIVAVSAEDHAVRWVYRYTGTQMIPELGSDLPLLAGSQNEAHSVSIDLSSRWTDSLPRIAENRILLTSRDSDELICLDLQTGRELWRSPRGLSRTIAAALGDIIVLLGNKTVTALNASDGSIAWQNEIRDGHVTGQALYDHRIVRIPTSAGTVITYDLRNGRQVLVQEFPGDEPPGNLIVTPSRLYSQTQTSLTSIALTSFAEPPSQLDRAGQQLLARDFDGAISTLENSLDSPDLPAAQRQQAREILVATLLESLRVDFTTYSRHIPKLRELIQQTSVSESQVLETMFSILGMNLTDAAVLPGQLEFLDKPGQQLDQLFELIVLGLSETRDQPPAEVAAAISRLLPEFTAARERMVKSGDVRRRNSRLLASGIRRLLQSRSVNDQLAIQQALCESAMTLAGTLHQSDKESILLIRDLMAAGLTLPAHKVTAALLANLPQAEPDPAASLASSADNRTLSLLVEQLLLNASSGGPQTDTATAAASMTGLLDHWNAASDEFAVRAVLADLRSPDAANEAAVLKFHAGAAVDLPAVLDAWLAGHPEYQNPKTDLWGGKPRIEVSDDRSMLPANQLLIAGPRSLLPIFGMQGIYRGWTFSQDSATQMISALDKSGEIRWNFEPSILITPQQSGLVTEKFVLIHGHLVAMKLNQMMFMLDTSRADPQTPPRLLWQVDVDSLHRDRDVDFLRRSIPGWERVPSYAPQPAGLFPCGPLTSLALPVISGRRLFVFDPVTGEQNWIAEGLQEDAVLLGTDESLIILSKSARQLEVRNLIDGARTAVTRVPDWWIEANESVGSSVRDIEVEPGLDLLWRVGMHGQSCVLFRLSAGKSVVECRDLVTDTVTWSITVPQETVFSNVAEDMLALLSNGSELRVIRIDTGTVLAKHTVAPVVDPRELYLRPSLNRLLILPESVEDPSLDLDPITSGLHVNGRLYALDRTTLELAWDRPLDHRHLRILNAPEGPTIPNAPILVLLNRYRKPRESGNPGIVSRYAAQVIDVNTGEDLYFGQDVGRTLNYHWLVVDALTRQLRLGFENFIVTFDYQNAGDDPKPPR